MRQVTAWLVVGTAALLVSAAPAHASPVTADYRSFTISFAQGTPTTSGLHDPMDPYVIGAQNWVAKLDPLNATYLRGPSINFANVLAAAFPTSAGWSYASAANELSDNSLVIHTYDVQGTPARVGAEFHLEYVPHGQDPTANVHWIQVVTDNHNITGNPGHGNSENVVDIGALGTTPYYDEFGAATSREFYDFPGRNDPGKAHNWTAELMLVSGPAVGAGPGLITFHGGVQWGWINVPEPATLLLVATAVLALVATRLRALRAAARAASAAGVAATATRAGMTGKSTRHEDARPCVAAGVGALYIRCMVHG